MAIAIRFIASRQHNLRRSTKFDDNTRLSWRELAETKGGDEAGFPVRRVCRFAGLRVQRKIGLRRIDDDPIGIGKNKGRGVQRRG